MSITIFTDTSANLLNKHIEENGLKVIPFSYYVEGEEHTCIDTDSFDAVEYYSLIKSGVAVTTSQITPQKYIDSFTPELEAGNDVLFVSMSSGISGSCSSARIAANQLMEEYPERKIKIVDTMGASLGEGLIALKACKLRDEGIGIDEAEAYLQDMVRHMCQVFTVDDLMHLRRGGRLSNLSAIVGTVLHIKPLLKGNSEGKIVAFGKVRGRKHSIEALAERYDRLAVEPENQVVGIAHSACKEDAEHLAELLKRNRAPKDIIMVDYEPVTGSHVGPGALALFFMGDENVREEN